MAPEPSRWGAPRSGPKSDANTSAGEGRWLARLLVSGFTPEWSSFSNEELRIAEACLDEERGRLAGRGIECTEQAVSMARVEIARERNRRLHLA